MKMSAIEQEIKQEFVSIQQAAKMLNISPSAIYDYKAGTEGLTRVPQGRRIFLVLAEVLEHRQKLITEAQERRKRLTLVGSQD
jgi:predicted transcriptional regulator